MKNTYFDLIDQSYYFPQEGFDIKNGFLTFYGLSLQHLIQEHGTPFRQTFSSYWLFESFRHIFLQAHMLGLLDLLIVPWINGGHLSGQGVKVINDPYGLGGASGK